MRLKVVGGGLQKKKKGEKGRITQYRLRKDNVACEGGYEKAWQRKSAH